MNVDVFTNRSDGQYKILAVPTAPPSVIPPDYQLNWQYYASISTSDRMFTSSETLELEHKITSNGYAILSIIEN